jgi:poly(3-hydroxybutyrate) depolymerase
MAGSARLVFSNPFNPLTYTVAGRHAAAACEVFERTTRRYRKPEFGLRKTRVDGAIISVSEEVVWNRPFCRLIHFRRDIEPSRAESDPRILLIAPMSGHFATLLRGTVEALLPNHDVYIVDWQDARDVPLSAGNFDLDDYIDYLREMLRELAGEVHLLAICQAAVPALAAVALMEEDGDAHVPASLILAGGPIDPRVSPTAVNRLAERHGTEWFRQNVITTVPWPNTGAGRSVYPGFLQLSGFMSMNLDRHVRAHRDFFVHLIKGDGDSVEKHCAFYDEYLSVMDLTAEFYLQTIDTVFVRHALPNRTMTHRGRPVDLSAIRNVPLMTVEGEKDDITGSGQCRAALDLCDSIPSRFKMHHESAGVGHYGIFNGSRFQFDIAPRIAQFARAHEKRTTFARTGPAQFRYAA